MTNPLLTRNALIEAVYIGLVTMASDRQDSGLWFLTNQIRKHEGTGRPLERDSMAPGSRQGLYTQPSLCVKEKSTL